MFMGFSFPKESGSDRLGTVAAIAGTRPATLRPVQKILYRSLGLVAMLAAVGFAAIRSAAQESTPEIVPLKKELRKKKDLGPRALGLLKMTASGKATLVPIMIEIDGKFYDASSYKADPVPMALESGIVYEGEKTGSPLGLFTINSALHSLAANADVPWIATGAWLAGGAEAPKTGMKAEAAPVGIENTDAPPRLTKGDANSSGTPSKATPPTTASAPEPAAPPANSAPAGTPPGAAPPASSSTTTPAAAPSTPKPEEKKDEKKTDQSKPDQKPVEKQGAAQSASSTDSSNDSNRPRLRRGKPTGPMPDYDVPGYGKPKSAKESGASSGGDAGAKTAGAAVPMEAVELIPAISDAGGPELRSYAYEWGQGDEADRRKQMLELAKQQLRAYIDARAKGQIPAKPAPRTGARKPAPKAAEPIIDNVQMRTFDLWGSNQPVLVMSAEGHLPPAVGPGAAELPAAPLQYKIMLVTRTDIYGNLHKLYSGVTDRFHLDVIPQLELIDAVDADGDGRGELLFRKTSDAGSGYVIYKATADTLWKMFDSVNRE
jgi:hypothetical protein